MDTIAEEVAVEEAGQTYLEFLTRELTLEECDELCDWLTALPGTVWSDEDRLQSYENLRQSRRSHLTLPMEQKSNFIYAKLKWA